MRRRYRFIGAVGNRLVWQAVLAADDSRVMEVRCNRAWFYGMMTGENPPGDISVVRTNAAKEHAEGRL